MGSDGLVVGLTLERTGQIDCYFYQLQTDVQLQLMADVKPCDADSVFFCDPASVVLALQENDVYDVDDDVVVCYEMQREGGDIYQQEMFSPS